MAGGVFMSNGLAYRFSAPRELLTNYTQTRIIPAGAYKYVLKLQDGGAILID